jgi:hypothetical protein
MARGEGVIMDLFCGGGSGVGRCCPLLLLFILVNHFSGISFNSFT